MYTQPAVSNNLLVDNANLLATFADEQWFYLTKWFIYSTGSSLNVPCFMYGRTFRLYTTRRFSQWSTSLRVEKAIIKTVLVNQVDVDNKDEDNVDKEYDVGDIDEDYTEDLSASSTLHENIASEEAQSIKEISEPLDYSLTPSLTRRLNNKFIQQTRIHSPIFSFDSREKNSRQHIKDTINFDKYSEIENCSMNLPLKQFSKRSLRRCNSSLEQGNELRGYPFTSSRIPESLFSIDGKEKISSSKWRSGEREYRRGYSASRIQDLPIINTEYCNSDTETNLISDGFSISACDSSTNLQDSMSSRSMLSCESSPANSLSNIQDQGLPYKSKTARNFEVRLLAAESLIKASKLKNFDDSKNDLNSNSKYESTNKNDDNSPDTISDMMNSMIVQRNSTFPVQRFRSTSLNREYSLEENRRKSFAGSQGTSNKIVPTLEKLFLSKYDRFWNHEKESKNEPEAEKGQRRISRFLRPDFFDTPREESQYVKEKEAKKAYENERRKSRFIKKRDEKAFETCENIPATKNKPNPIDEKEWDTSPEDQNSDFESINQANFEKIDSSPSLEKSYSTMPNQPLLSNNCEIEKHNPFSRDNSTVSTTYIPDNVHAVESTVIDEKIMDEKSLESCSKSKTGSKSKVQNKDEVKTDGANMRFGSKIPTKFKKNESNSVKKGADNKKLANKNIVEPGQLLSSKIKKENEVSFLQRSKAEVKKSLENCTKLVKRYSLENSKKLKSEKEIGPLKYSKTEKLPKKEKSVEKNITKNSVQLEIISDKNLSEKKRISKTSEKSIKQDNKQDVNTDNTCEENGKENIKKASILPTLSKINSSMKAIDDKAERKMHKRTKIGETKESDNSTKKKKVITGVKKTEMKSTNNSIRGLEKAKQSSETVFKVPSDNSMGTDIVTFKKIESIKVDENDSRSSLSKLKKSYSDESILHLNDKSQIEFKNIELLKKNSSQSTPKKERESSESKLEDLELNATQDLMQLKSDEDDNKLVFESNSSQFLKHFKESKRYEISDDLQMDSVNGIVSQIENRANSISYSVCSTDSEIIGIQNQQSSSTVVPPGLRDQPEQESIIDRIRRKSFYSRFNDRKRKTPVAGLSSRTAVWPSLTIPRNFSFNSPKREDQMKTNNYMYSNIKSPEKRYSLYNNTLPSAKITANRNRYSVCSSNAIPSSDSMHDNVNYSSIDMINSRRRNPGIDFVFNNDSQIDTNDGRAPREVICSDRQIIEHNEETEAAAKKPECWTSAYFPNENFESQCSSYDLNTEDGVDSAKSSNEDG